MDPVVLTDIPFEPDLPSLLQKMRAQPGSSRAAELERLAGEAQAVARPKAMYGLAFVESRGDDHVVVEGNTFTSRVLRVNLDPVNRVFPFVATCGTELDDWASSIDDFLHHYAADYIMELALRTARTALQNHLEDRYGLATISAMNPGSLADWPLREQRPLFTLLRPDAHVGVRLSESMIMTPLKSVSGLLFQTEVGFASCQLCPRPQCPSRRADYDRTLLEEKYGPPST
jgi:cobalamin-dependent methionine synthase I